ncbi:MAG: metallophosphoesterase family protein [Thermocladium sp.]
MKILLLSDIHWPSDAAVKALSKARNFDMLILAGDFMDCGLSVACYEASFDSFFRLIKKVSGKKEIIAVLGNHEHYLSRNELRRGITSLEKIASYRKYFGEHDSVLLDFEGPYCINGFCIAGNVGWYDYSFAVGYDFKYYDQCNPYGCSVESLWQCERQYCNCPDYFRDCLYVRLGMSNGEYLSYNVNSLRKQLSKVNQPTILVLHHAPRKDIIKDDGFYSAYDGSNKLDEVVREFGSRYVVYGHVHERGNSIEVRDGVVYINSFYPNLVAMRYSGGNLEIERL